MTLPDVHLAEEALAAYADGLLSPVANERAERHLRGCACCRAAVEAQREAKVLMAAAPDPELPSGLMARLLQVPMTADLGGGDLVLAVDRGEFVWARATNAGAPIEPRVVERSRQPQAAALAVAGSEARRPAGSARPSGPGPSGGGLAGPGRAGRGPAGPGPVAPGPAAPRPAQWPAPFARLRRGRRGLAVSLAGLAFGVIASTAPTAMPAAAPVRPGGAPSTPPSGVVVNATVGGSPVRVQTFPVTAGATRQGVLVGGRSYGR